MGYIVTGLICFGAGAFCSALYLRPALDKAKAELETLKSFATNEVAAFRKKL